MDLCDLSAFELSQLIHQRKVSVVDVLKAHLKRIEAVDGRPGTLDAGEITEVDKMKVHAFITPTPERALNQAEALDRRLAAGEDPGLLAGIPFTVKDIFCVKGTPSTAASRILAKEAS